MRKINSRQRRSNRWLRPEVRAGRHMPERRWFIAHDREYRRLVRQYDRRNTAPKKKCVSVPCPPFVDEVLTVL